MLLGAAKMIHPAKPVKRANHLSCGEDAKEMLTPSTSAQ
jgi:hypothetical protein